MNILDLRSGPPRLSDTVLRLAAGVALVVGGAVSLPASAALTLTVQPIQICKDDGTGCANAAQKLFEAEGDKIWAQAGIDLVFLPWAKLNETDYLDISVDDGSSTIMQESRDVMTAGTAINDTASTKAINMFFAMTLDNVSGFYGNGCGGPVFSSYCNNQVGVFIADSVFSYNGGVGRLDTIAHELGHVLNLTHTSIGDQLMAAGGTPRLIPGSIDDIYPDGLKYDKLTDAQIAVALNSSYLTDSVVPEPGSLALLGLGLFGIAARRRATP